MKRKCSGCGRQISGEYYTLHMERRGKAITVIEDKVLCKRCGDKIAKAGGLFR